MRVAQVALVVAVLAAGAWVRWLPRANSPLVSGAARSGPAWPASSDAIWFGAPWSTRLVTVYHLDGVFLFPVSHRASRTDSLAHAAVQALLDGPPRGAGLTRALPNGWHVRSLEIVEREARLDLGGPASRNIAQHVVENVVKNVVKNTVENVPDAMAATSPAFAALVQTALVQTLTAVPGIDTVTLLANGHPVATAARRPLLYFAGTHGLTAVTTTAATPRATVDAFLQGPESGQRRGVLQSEPGHALIGLPRDVQLRDYQLVDGVVSLALSYTPSVRTLAIERPDTMRTVLLGLIASLTEHASVRAVTLDFEGHSRLGLGACSDLLRVPQRKPRLLNDERLVGR